MRLKVYDRMISALAGLLITASAVLLFLIGIDVLPVSLGAIGFADPLLLWQRILVIAVSVILLVVGLHSISFLFRSSRDKGYMTQHTDFGDMSISMKAMEGMVRKCVDSHPELKVGSAFVRRGREGVVVELKLVLASGVNIPLTVNALQRQIKQYITSCSGIDVQEVRVMVETDNSRLALPAPQDQIEQEPCPSVTVDHKKKTNGLFHHKDEPENYVSADPEAVVVKPENEPVESVEVPEPEVFETVAVPAETAETVFEETEMATEPADEAEVSENQPFEYKEEA